MAQWRLNDNMFPEALSRRRGKEFILGSLIIPGTNLSECYPKCCIKHDADILKNLCKATRFDYETHDCTFNL
jgi:hypothetical protein